MCTLTSVLKYVHNFQMKILMCIVCRCDTYCYRQCIAPVKNDEDVFMRDVEGQWQGIKCGLKGDKEGIKNEDYTLRCDEEQSKGR